LDLIAASIIRRLIDLPTMDDVSLSFMALSAYGTKLAEIDVSFKYKKTIEEYADLNAQKINET